MNDSMQTHSLKQRYINVNVNDVALKLFRRHMSTGENPCSHYLCQCDRESNMSAHVLLNFIIKRFEEKRSNAMLAGFFVAISQQV